MKIIDPITVCRGFAICKGDFGPGVQNEQSVKDTSEDFKFSQIFVLLEGSGTFVSTYDVISKDGYGNPVPTSNGIASDFKHNAWDLRDYYKRSYKFVAGNRGAKWMCINPLPANGFFDFELIGEGSKSITNDNGNQRYVVAAKGPIVVNNKLVDQFKYVRIFKDVTANIEVPQGSSALYMHR